MRLIKCLLTLYLMSFPLSLSAQEFAFYAINFKPAAYLENDEKKGYYVEILSRIARQLGASSSEVILAPYPRIQAELNNNEDKIVITCLFPSVGFNEKVFQPSSIGHFDTGIISMKNNPVTWNNILNKRIATVKGASKAYGELFHRLVLNQQIQLISVSDYDQALLMLGKGRIDAFAGNLPAMLFDANNRGMRLAESLTINHRVSRITISVGSNIKDAELWLTKIAGIVDKMRDSGEIQTIIEAYLPDAVQPRN